MTAERESHDRNAWVDEPVTPCADFENQCAMLPPSLWWLLLKVLMVCAVAVGIACFAFMGGCQASGEGKGGASAFEHRRELPTTEKITIEQWGDGPIDPAVLLALPRGTVVEKKR